MTEKNVVFFDKTDMLEVQTFKDILFRKILPYLTGSAVSGIFIGLIVTLFNLMLEKISEVSKHLSKLVEGNLAFLPLYILCAAILGIIMLQLIKILPQARGSGIPRTEAMLNGKKHVNWWKMSLATVLGSAISFFAGLSVGSEGPSVQLGAGLAHGFEKLSGFKGRRRYISNSGAAAGVATAFGAPLTGVIFVQEEVQRKFNPLMTACACASVLYAMAINSFLAKAFKISENFFIVPSVLSVPTNFLWTSVVIGIACAFCSLIFNESILRLGKLSRKSKVPQAVWIIGAFVVSSIVDVFIIDGMGSGISIINTLVTDGYAWQTAMILFIVKFLLICLCFRSGTTGGMMVPMLTVGALIGGMLSYAFVDAGMSETFFATTVLIAMCTFFGASICAPLTVVALFVETTGGFTAFFPLVISIFVAQIIGKILHQKPLYDTLAESEYVITEFIDY